MNTLGQKDKMARENLDNKVRSAEKRVFLPTRSMILLLGGLYMFLSMTNMRYR